MKRSIIVAAGLIAVLLISGCGKSRFNSFHLEDGNDSNLTYMFVDDGRFLGSIDTVATGHHTFMGTYTIRHPFWNALTGKDDEITMTLNDFDDHKPVGDLAKPETGSIYTEQNNMWATRIKTNWSTRIKNALQQASK